MTIDKEAKIVARFAWWLKPYMHVLAFLCFVTNQQPDWDKFERTVKKAIRLKIVDD